MQLSIEKSCEIFKIRNIEELDKYTDNEIRKLYHKLCLQYHPDKTKNGNTQTFIEIRNAYDAILEHRKNVSNKQQENDSGTFESSEHRFYKFLIGLFNDETVNNVINMFERILENKYKNGSSEHTNTTITYHVTINQVINKEVFYHEKYQVYIPLWHKVISLYDFENYNSNIRHHDNVVFVLKIKEDDNHHMKILENNDILIYKSRDNSQVNKKIEFSLGEKNIEFLYTPKIMMKRYHILLNEGIPRINTKNIYDFSQLSNIIICFV